jgi:bacillolysin
MALRRRLVSALSFPILVSISVLATDLTDRFEEEVQLSLSRNGIGPTSAKAILPKSGSNSIPEFDVAIGELLKSIKERNPSNVIQAVPKAPLLSPNQSIRRTEEWAVAPAENGTPRQMRRLSGSSGQGRGIAKASVVDVERQVRTFLQQESSTLQQDDPSAELGLLSEEVDELGCRHFRFQQQYSGLPIWPTGLSVHLDPDGEIDLVDASTVPSPSDLNLTPAVVAQSAVNLGKAAVPGGFAGTNTSPELIIYAPTGGHPSLAWRFRVMVGPLRSWTTVVSARSGRTLLLQSDSQNAAVQGSGAGLNGTPWNFPVWSANGGYFLMDTTKPSFRPGSDPVTNPQGVIQVFDLFNRELGTASPEPVFSVSTNQWSSGDAVSALVNLGFTYDCFLNLFQRNGISGKGDNLFAVVRSGGLPNAYFLPESKVMVFGDAEPYAGSLDVVAHELTHGITDSSAKLVYRGQSGALNEAFSDIFGEMVESYAFGTHDWLAGSSLSAPIRDLREPGRFTYSPGQPYPAHMSQFAALPATEDGGGVHVNSSIINRAFYLLAEGLPNNVGLRDAASVFYRCLTVHLQPQSQFIDCRLGCLAAAAVLFPDRPATLTAVGDAFDAVGIVDLPPTPSPGRLPPVDAPDSALAIYHNAANTQFAMARRESALGDDPFQGSTKIRGVKKARLAVTGDGREFVFVSEGADLCYSQTESPADSLRCLGFDGLVFSVAISPSASKFALVRRDRTTGEPQGVILVTDGKISDEYQLLAPVMDGISVDTIRFAEHLSFSPDGRLLVFDALSAVHFGNGPKVERWSLYLLDVETGMVSVVVPPLEDFNVANPVFGRTSDRLIAFEGRQISSGNSAVLVYDRFAGALGGIVEVQDGFGYPDFTGDDRSVIYAGRDGLATLTGFSLYRQSLAANGVDRFGFPTLWLRDAVLGVVYRRGTYRSVNERPTVSLATQPAASAVIVGSAVTLNAPASDPDNPLAYVEFWSGGTRIAVDTVAPYSVTIPSIGLGAFNFVARAVDAYGMTTDSQAFRMVATLPVKRLGFRLQNDGTILLNVEAPQGNHMIEGSADLQSWADLQAVNIGPEGKGIFTFVPAVGGTQAFLRLR